MIDVNDVKVGDVFVLRQNDPERVEVVAKDKEGNSYRVTKTVPRTIEIKLTVIDRVVETRDSGSKKEWFEVEYNRPAVDEIKASKQAYLVPIDSPLWNSYERI